MPGRSRASSDEPAPERQRDLRRRSGCCQSDHLRRRFEARHLDSVVGRSEVGLLVLGAADRWQELVEASAFERYVDELVVG